MLADTKDYARPEDIPEYGGIRWQASALAKIKPPGNSLSGPESLDHCIGHLTRNLINRGVTMTACAILTKQTMIKEPHPAFIENVEQRCRGIVPRFEPRQPQPAAPKQPRGPKPVVTLRPEDILSMKPQTRVNHLNQVTAAMRGAADGTWLIDGAEYGQVVDLASSILEKLDLSDVVGKPFLQELISEWVFDHQGQQQEGFFAHVMQKVRGAIKTIEVDVPLNGVKGNVSFKFNGVRFGPRSDWLNKWFELSRTAPYKDEQQRLGMARKNEELRSEYGESYWASFVVRAEESEGKRIANAAMAEVADLVRAFCVDGYHPLRYVGFVPGRKLRDGSFACSAIDGGVQISEAAPEGQQFLWLDEQAVRMMMVVGLARAEAMHRKEVKTDMEIVVLGALRELGKVSGLPGLSDKLVYGCTALEQVFLRDQNEPILASMPQRCAMVMEDDVAERKRLIKTIKASYSFRSQRVHHGIEADANEDICDFFKLLWLFASKLVFLPDQFKTKAELLASLDDRLLTG